MKQKIKKTAETPKYAISIALIIAVSIGIVSSILHNKSRAELFSKNIAESPSTTTTHDAGQKNLTLAFATGGRIKTVSVRIGDRVKAGAILASLDAENALGAVTQAQGAYAAAQNTYNKLMNGTTATDIQVAKVALDNAQSAYENVVTQQKILMTNAHRALLNTGLVAVSNQSSNNTVSVTAPTISGTYTEETEGIIALSTHSGGAGYFTTSGLINTIGEINASTPVPLGSSGLFIQFPANFAADSGIAWTIQIPNTQASGYVAAYNAYQSAVQNQAQAVAIAEGAIDAARAALEQKQAGARPEDLAIAEAQVQSTEGALQIAQGAYNNTIIVAPTDGTVTDVKITAGQIAIPNIPAIELLSQ